MHRSSTQVVQARKCAENRHHTYRQLLKVQADTIFRCDDESISFSSKKPLFPLSAWQVGVAADWMTVSGKEGGNILSKYMADEKLSITTVINYIGFYWMGVVSIISERV